jgi:hypothetical protein
MSIKNIIEDIEILDRNEGIFKTNIYPIAKAAPAWTPVERNWYIDMTGMLYPNQFLKNVANSMSDVFVYDEPGGDSGSGHWRQGIPEDVTDEDIIGFIFTNSDCWSECEE